MEAMAGKFMSFFQLHFKCLFHTRLLLNTKYSASYLVTHVSAWNMCVCVNSFFRNVLACKYIVTRKIVASLGTEFWTSGRCNFAICRFRGCVLWILTWFKRILLCSITFALRRMLMEKVIKTLRLLCLFVVPDALLFTASSLENMACARK